MSESTYLVLDPHPPLRPYVEEYWIPPAEVRAMIGQAAEERDPHLRARPLERFLLRRLGGRRVDEPARLAALRLWRSAGVRPVALVAKDLGISRRHLSRCFRATIGTTPKSFSAIARFQWALADHRCGLPWTDVAAAGGFTDQAHLVKEVRRFAGLTPTRLRVEGETELLRRFNGEAHDGPTAGREPSPPSRDGGHPRSRIHRTVHARSPSLPGCIAV